MNGIKYLEEFKTYIQLEKGLGKNTILSYEDDIVSFLLFFKEKNLRNIRQDDILNFIEHINKSYSRNSILRKISSLREFYKFLVRNYNFSNAIEGIDSAKKLKPIPEYLNQTEISQILNTFAMEKEGQRDRLIFMFLIMTGGRISEILNIKIEDIDFNMSTLRLFGKGEKYRVVPLDPELTKITGEYVKNWRGIFKESKGNFLLFAGMSRSNFYARLRIYAKKAGLVKKIYPHMLRHSVATLMLEEGANIRTVQELLGHSSVSTTEIYAHVAKKKLKQIYDRAGIRN